eukprot:gene483-908_t
MRKSNHSNLADGTGSQLSCLQIFVIISVICFGLGFFGQVLLLGAHHDNHMHPAPALRARYIEPIPKKVDIPISTGSDSRNEPEESRTKIESIESPSENIQAGQGQYGMNEVNENDLNKKYGSGGEAEVPNIVKAWRNAKLDWHLLLPKHNSIWERFGSPKTEGKFPLLVAKEQQATDFLTRFRESGLAGKYGKEHGNLLDYSGCNTFSDACIIHNNSTCFDDQLCHWDIEKQLCLDGNNIINSKPLNCNSPKRIQGQSILPINSIENECKSFVEQPSVIVSIDSESQTMFYHWWATWASIRDFWNNNLHSNRNTHFILPEITDPMFFQYFGIISNNCWRRSSNQIPQGTCFCNVQNFQASQTRSNTVQSVTIMLDYLNLKDIQPPKDHVKIGLISRRKKRFVLNEYELVDSIRAMGYECVILPLETMTIYEQTKELRTLDVLIGIHGSALDNSVFLHPGSVLVQLLPYKVEHRVTFQSSAQQAGMVYMEWQLKDR